MNELCGILQRARTAAYISEPISQLEHALQAAHTAELAGEDDEMIIACLLHDVGHQLPVDEADDADKELGIINHAQKGAAFLRLCGLPDALCSLVGLHAEAKCYMVAVDDTYVLSPASAATLVRQGGKMSQSEVVAFQKNHRWKAAVRLRLYDDAAKVVLEEPLEDDAALFARYVGMMRRLSSAE